MKAHPSLNEMANLLGENLSLPEEDRNRFIDTLRRTQRELEIQAALERMRDRSMAMRESGELHDVLSLFFQQFDILGIKPVTAFLSLFDIDNNTFTYRSTSKAGSRSLTQQVMDLDSLDLWRELAEKWKNDSQDEVEVIFYDREMLPGLFDLFEETFSAMPEAERISIEDFPDGGYAVQGYCKFGYLGYNHQRPPTEAEKSILIRFSKEFGRVYQRFLDIKKAEAQAREAQIEAALERVRARSMSMHNTSELQDVINTVYQQFLELKADISGGAFIVINSEIESELVCWGAGGTAPYMERVHVPYMDMPIYTEMLRGIKEGPVFFTESFSRKEKIAFFEALFRNPPYNQAPPGRKEELLTRPGGYTRSCMVSELTSIFIVNHHGRPFSDEDNDILRRMGNVFEQTYTRFLDLQRAEAQAREAQIEAALERIRAHTMAMQESGELTEVLSVIFRQLKSLGIDTVWTHLTLLHLEENAFTYRMTGRNGARIMAEEKIAMDASEHWSHISDSILSPDQEVDPITRFEVPPENLGALWELFDGIFSKLPEGEKVTPGDFPNGLYTTQAYCKFGFLGLNQPRESTPEEADILLRFTTEFSRLYQRFLDLQNAEKRAREAQIEVALERVRARTMAMHKSEELGEVAAVLFEQIEGLGATMERLNIGIVREEEEIIEWWSTEQGGRQINRLFKGSIHEPTTLSKIYKAWKKSAKKLELDQTGDELKQWIKHVKEVIGLPFSPELVRERRVQSMAFFKHGMLLVSAPEPLPGESMNLLERFSGVFEQTYTRFLDLQNAEAQAREAQIEAALERVRAKTMAMHKTEDIAATVAVFFDELIGLGLDKHLVCGINILSQSERGELWVATDGHSTETTLYKGYLDMTSHPMLKQVRGSWERGESYYSHTLKGDEIPEYYKVLNAAQDFNVQLDTEDVPEKEYYWNVHFQDGYLCCIMQTPLPDEIKKILERFASVFSQTYTRYLDLQKAEQRARESEIEAALERVRAKTMAMHNTDDIADTVVTFFEELLGLGLDDSMRAGIGILSQSEQMNLWAVSVPDSSKTILHTGYLDMTGHALLRGAKRAWAEGASEFSYLLEGADLISYFNYLNEAEEYPAEFDLDKLPETINHRSIPFKDGFLFIFTQSPVPEDIVRTLERFAAVFGQTYTRYLDLEQAERQARESRIEAALERVRAKALAMHNSEDLRETITRIFEELKQLEVSFLRMGLGLLSPNEPVGEIITSRIDTKGEIIEVSGTFRLEGHPVLNGVYAHFKKQHDYFPVLQGEEIKSYYAALTRSVDIEGYGTDTTHYGCFLYFPEGGFYTWAAEPHSEAQIEILKKFSRVVEITYRRFNDLVEAEAREKEAIKQASLDRVRAEIASMRNSEDLERIMPLIWNELTTLGVPFFRCGISIVNESDRSVQTYLSNPEGKSLGVWRTQYGVIPLFDELVKSWQKQETYRTEWDREAFLGFSKLLKDAGLIEDQERYQSGADAPEFLVLHLIPFKQGMLYVGSKTELNATQMELVRALAGAFSVAYARYEDFNELEKAKRAADRTLSELRETQKQLIHSEKMASLGELTAGIAHEIKNPLNFVNNFSEVSRELLEELTEELEKGDLEEVHALAKDLTQNLEKIVHHGQRADSIVKGMLQHSRSSDGKKEKTNLNDLADEYMRLAYHGLRAKDKSFNAAMETDFDPDLPKISVVPQDMGRVLLNLLTNAFHAVAEHKKSAPKGYKPKVSVKTSRNSQGVEIKVIDNGAGIPDQVRDKIFQPFFTTKPTGQGTGLGLSLSYDIVKAHGGELKVDTREGQGTTFIINLQLTS